MEVAHSLYCIMYWVMIPFLCSIGIAFHEISNTVELIGLPLISFGGEDGSKNKFPNSI